MGLAERDYRPRTSDSDSRFAALREWSVTTWLIALTILVFVLDAMLTPPPWDFIFSDPAPERFAREFESGEYILRLFGPLVRWGHFSAATALNHLELWRFVTFPFVHIDIWLLAMNLACLYGFGRVLEAEVGTRRFLVLNLLCILAAAAAYVALYAFRTQITAPWWPLAGASANVLGVLVATALIAPDDEIPIMTTGVFLPRRALAWITFAIVAVIVIKRDATGANVAHLGGAVAGLLAVPFLRRPRFPRIA